MQLPPDVSIARRRNRDTPVRRPDPQTAGTSSDAPTADVTELSPASAELIEQELLHNYRWLRFSPLLEAQFEADSIQGRKRHLFIAGAVGMLIFDSFAISNPFMLPDVASLSWKLRLALTPLFLISLASLRLSLKTWQREGIFAASVAAAALGVLGLVALSHETTAVSHLAALVLIPMFAGIIMRLRFWHTLWCSALILVASPIVVHGRDAQQTLILQDNISILAVAVLFTLAACYVLEHRERTAFLLGVLDQRRREALGEISERLRRLSMVDPVTGIYNRSQFEVDLETAWMQAAFNKEPLSLLILEVDFFTAFTDGCGRLEADTCLRRIANVLRDIATERKGTAARLGSEEFALLLPQREIDMAVKVGETVRVAVQALRVRHEASPVAASITVSVGAASAAPLPEEPPVLLLQMADDALHEAKHSGCNRVAGRTVNDYMRPSGGALH
jgi:diguanylate cyclase (GGDEF)-like protein